MREQIEKALRESEERYRSLGKYPGWIFYLSDMELSQPSVKRAGRTTFTIYLPASDKPVSEAKNVPAEPADGVGTILLIDDEEMILDIGKSMLEKPGYQVLVAGSGPEAVEIYRRQPNEIDLVILDLTMPEMNGSETYDRLKAIDPRIRVLFSSGYSMDGVADEILKRDSVGFIQKPFDIKKLSRNVRQAMKCLGK